MSIIAPIAHVFELPADRADEWRVARGAIRLLELPPHRFAMIDGEGPPAEAAFAARMPGLYTAAYGLHFGLKRRGVEGPIGPLEGLWWTADGRVDLDAIFEGDRDRDTWRWTLLIGLPDAATDSEISSALEAARVKLEEPHASNLRVETFDEGRVAQVMHVGPYAEERTTIERLHAAIAAAGLTMGGRHHELYLGDPRRSAPENLRTILRQPLA
jgi:hypothetical protein